MDFKAFNNKLSNILLNSTKKSSNEEVYDEIIRINNYISIIQDEIEYKKLILPLQKNNLLKKYLILKNKDGWNK